MTAEDRRAAPAPAASVWRNPAYVRLWIGESLSQVGESLGNLAIPVVAVITLSASAAQIGYLSAAQTLAFLLIGLPVGAWVDRMRKRRVMVVADAVRAATLLAVPLLWWAGALQIWMLFAVAAVVGGATVFFDVSYQSYVPSLVRGEQIASANSGLETSAQVARVGGPALSGALLTIVAAPLLLLANSIGYVLSLLFVSSIRDAEQKYERKPGGSLVRDIREGLHFVFTHRMLRTITINTAATNLLEGLMSTLLSIFVLRQLGLAPAIFGLIEAIAAGGGILGALVAPWVSRKLGQGPAIVISSIVSAAVGLLIPLSAYVPGWAAAPLLLGANFVWILTVVTYNITQVSFRQRLCPPRLLGRMNASIRFVVWGVSPIAGVLAGWLGSGFGILPTMWLGAAGCLVATAAILLPSELPRTRTLPERREDATA